MNDRDSDLSSSWGAIHIKRWDTVVTVERGSSVEITEIQLPPFIKDQIRAGHFNELELVSFQKAQAELLYALLEKTGLKMEPTVVDT